MNGSDGSAPRRRQVLPHPVARRRRHPRRVSRRLSGALEEHLEHPIGRYFDLIAGTSTGGIIAIGLGLGLSASDILKLYVEQGPAIFDQQHGAHRELVRQKLRGSAASARDQALVGAAAPRAGRRARPSAGSEKAAPAW